MTKTELKQKIRNQLKKTDFPDMKFLFSREVLAVSLELLREMLSEEKDRFKKLLETPKQEINFKTFDEEKYLSYFWSLLNHLNNVDKSEDIKKIIDSFEWEYIDFGNEVWYNKDYYKMYEYCLENCDLDNEEKRIIEETIKDFKLRGIDLESQKQEKIKEINKRLAKLSNDFSNNIVDDEASYEYRIDNFDYISDLPEATLDIAESLAKKKDFKGHIFNADPTWYLDLMKYCTNSSIRKEVYTDFMNFASKGKFDNRPLILEILSLKDKKAKLLWYKNFAEYNMQKKMADSPEQVFDLIGWISKKAKNKALEELEELKAYFDLDELNPWDLAFYSRKLKEEKYSLDDKKLKEYFELENVLNYLHSLVNELYGIELVRIDLESYNEDVRVYEVKKEWKLISYYFLDLFYREDKRWWAWADNLRAKQDIDWETKLPVVLNVCNFQKSTSWSSLLTIRDVETIFHEFWHALHEMLSESVHSELSWFWVEWDFVELPSQIHENWVSERSSLERFAKHHKSWEIISRDLLDKLDSLKTFMSWNFVIRQNEFALLDMHLHSSSLPENIENLDKKVLDIVNDLSIFKRWEDYKMYTSFGHIFGWWYAAGYYSYMWAEIIEADVFAEIKRLGMFERSTWEKFLQTILWQGCRKSAKDLFYDFMWREVDNKAFMERKGLN